MTGVCSVCGFHFVNHTTPELMVCVGRLVDALQAEVQRPIESLSLSREALAARLPDDVLHEAQTAQRVAFETAKSDHRKTSLDAMRQVLLTALTGAGDQ